MEFSTRLLSSTWFIGALRTHLTNEPFNAYL